jgi:hypothetical protein
VNLPFLLTPGHEDENLFPALRGPGGAIEFFEERGISWWRTSKLENAKLVDRPSRHMLSSQVSCVNFLMPLAQSPAALLALLRAVDDDVAEVVPINHHGRTALVELEWVGVDGPLEPGDFVRGSKCTSVDAFLIARTPRGLRAYLIEWKYTESCGDALGPGEDRTRLLRYRDLYDRSGLFAVPLDGVLWEPAYQLIRSLLLGCRTIERSELGVVEARTIVVCPEANAAYRSFPPDHPLACPGVDSVGTLMTHLLRDPSRFGIASQGLLMRTVLSSGAPLPQGWAEYHAARYDWTAPLPEGLETRQ